VNIKNLQRNWEGLAQGGPFHAILTDRQEWEDAAFFATGVEEVRALLEHVRGLAIPLNRGLALDFGCGVGRLTLALGEYFDHLIGVDISPTMIQGARKYAGGSDKVEYLLNQRDDLAIFRSDSFDFIYTNITLQHVAPRYSRKYIREFIRILKPRGLLVFQLPSELKPRKGFKQIARVVLPSPVQSAVRRIRGGLEDVFRAEPRMEMHGIPIREVRSLIKANRGVLLDTVEDLRPTAERSWISYRYTVTK